MKNNDRCFDFCEEKERRHDCECEDFDFCDDDCDFGDVGRRYDSGFGRSRNDDYGRRNRNCECHDRDRDRDCECHDRDNDCDCNRDRSRNCECNDRNRDCDCHDQDHDRECCCENDRGFGFGQFGDCCEETPRCSDFRDFNVDERCGCNSCGDAAQSDDSWFDCQDEECCKRCRDLCDEDKCFCKKLKCRIQVLDFALQETILFLDTHPCDFEALRYYRIIRRKLARLEKLYECKCGPLTNQGVDTEFGWEWACCPWPWEGKD